MKIAAIVHLYPPLHNAGAELMLHSTLRYFHKQGHTTVVWCSHWPADGPSEWQGIPIIGPHHQPRTQVVAWADVAITHLDETRDTILAATITETPIAHLVHNDKQLAMNGVTPSTSSLAIFNSRWLCATVAWPGRQIILSPPVPPSDYQVKPLRRSTSRNLLVNVSAQKGSDVFYELARRLPERRFTGVLGAYNAQVKERLPNVELLSHTPRMRSVYREARVLLVPSVYESYGRVCIEAGWAGVPSIYHPTLGLVESVGQAGVAADRMRIDRWEAALDLLDDPKEYDLYSGLARENAEAAWQRSRGQLAALDVALREIVGERQAA